MIKGGCYCGQFRFEVTGEIREVVFCHCRVCQKITGNFVAASQVDNDNLTFSGELSWFESTSGFERSFCPTCGSQLFWRDTSETKTSIMAGAFDEDVVLKGGRHICLDEKPDHYAVNEHDRVNCG